MTETKAMPGADAVACKGWLRTYRWLLLRRASQIGILALFLLGPLANVWIVKGTLTSSLTLDILPLTDPFVFAQTVFAGHVSSSEALVGVSLVVAFYALVSGRVYCSWVCPLNLATDFAAWLQQKLSINTAIVLPRNTRYWLIALAMVMAMVSGTLAWEQVNPVSVIHRGMVFGMGMAWLILLAIILLDLLISRRGWCGHLCPVGAFYSLLSRWSPLRVSAIAREQCDDCMDCFVVCPEPQVIRPALKGEKEETRLIMSSQCTNCGRCIDICGKEVFRFANRYKQHAGV